MRQAVKTERWNRFAGKADRFAAALILVLALAFMLALTFCAIFGLVIGSPVALLMQNRECFQLANAGNWIASIVCLVIGFAIAWFMSRLDGKQSQNRPEEG